LGCWFIVNNSVNLPAPLHLDFTIFSTIARRLIKTISNVIN